MILAASSLLHPPTTPIKNYVDIRVSAQSRTYHIGQPVRLDLELKNLGKKSVYLIGRLAAGSDVSFWVTDERRREVKLTDYNLIEFGAPKRSNFTLLSPGGVLLSLIHTPSPRD